MSDLVTRRPALPAHIAQDRVIQRLREAEKALGLAVGIDQVKLVMDAAAAQEVFAQRQELGEELIAYAHTIKIRALAKLGELLQGLEKQGGGRGREGGGRRGSTREPRLDAPATLSDLGISKKLSSIAQQLASQPPEIREAIAQREVPLAKALRAKRVADNRAAWLTSTPWPTGTYGVILADPPWRPTAGTLDPSRQIENQYPTMTRDDLVAMGPDVRRLRAPQCVLLLWVATQKLDEAVALVEAWGFQIQSGAVWVKPSIGMGYWFRAQHELLILATHGTPPTPLPADRPSSVITAPRREHSEKPHEQYALIDRMFPGVPKVELFARTTRDGWDRWGNNAT